MKYRSRYDDALKDAARPYDMDWRFLKSVLLADNPDVEWTDPRSDAEAFARSMFESMRRTQSPVATLLERRGTTVDQMSEADEKYLHDVQFTFNTLKSGGSHRGFEKEEGPSLRPPVQSGGVEQQPQPAGVGVGTQRSHQPAQVERVKEDDVARGAGGFKIDAPSDTSIGRGVGLDGGERGGV